MPARRAQPPGTHARLDVDGDEEPAEHQQQQQGLRAAERRAGVREAWPGLGPRRPTASGSEKKRRPVLPSCPRRDLTYVPLEDGGGDARGRPGARQPHEVAAADVAGEEGGAHLEAKGTDAVRAHGRQAGLLPTGKRPGFPHPSGPEPANYRPGPTPGSVWLVSQKHFFRV